MATLYTDRLIVVVRAVKVVSANTAATVVDPVGGAQTFTVPLRQAGDATNTVVSYWTGWTMKADESTALRQALRDNGFKPTEVGLVPLGNAPSANADMWAFDAREGQWTPSQVLSALSFDRLALVMV